jgi:hypothetical protein
MPRRLEAAGETTVCNPVLANVGTAGIDRGIRPPAVVAAVRIRE